MKTALVTGVAGQDGAFLAGLLLREGYNVIGTLSGASRPPGFVEEYVPGVDLRTVDITDERSMGQLLADERPDEIYNLAAISSVGESWNNPVEVISVNGVAFVGLLEQLRSLRTSTGYAPRICQASSSEIFGRPSRLPQREGDPIRATNPYAVAKTLAHFSAVSYREAFGMFVATVILFNHESPLRPRSFVTRKITSAVAEISAGRRDVLELGRLDVRRDWGAASDYVRAMRLALAHPEPGDYVVATGSAHSVGEFVEAAFAAVGITDIRGLVRSSPALYRSSEIPETRGDPARAQAQLGWSRLVPFDQLVASMVSVDVRRLETGIEHHRDYLLV